MLWANRFAKETKIFMIVTFMNERFPINDINLNNSITKCKDIYLTKTGRDKH